MTATDDLKQQIVDAAARLVGSGILTKSNHGNISVRVPGSDTFLLTSVSNLGQITLDGIGLFDLDNNLIGGSVMPASAEIIPMHGIVYKTRPQAGSVLHTHSPFATAFAVASKAIPVAYEPLVRFGFHSGVPVADYGPRGSQESVENIRKVLDCVDQLRGLLLENHGVLTFGQDLGEAVQANLVMEESAEIIMYANNLGGAKEVPPHMRVAVQQRMQEFAAKGTQVKS
jgi:L-ribulose-5-phosphate 4-epimerase